MRPIISPCGQRFLSAPGMNRTCDLRFRKPSLYPLSYGGGDGAKCGAKFADTPHVINSKGYLRFWAGDSGEQGVTRETAVIFSL